jgi:hypothetical protein
MEGVTSEDPPCPPLPYADLEGGGGWNVWNAKVSRKRYLIEEETFGTLRALFYSTKDGLNQWKSIVRKQNKQFLGYDANENYTIQMINYRLHMENIEYKWKHIEYKWRI